MPRGDDDRSIRRSRTPRPDHRRPDAADLFGAGLRNPSGPAACAAQTGRTHDRTSYRRRTLRPSPLALRGRPHMIRGAGLPVALAIPVALGDPIGAACAAPVRFSTSSSIRRCAADQQSTRRAQDRESVSQALERVRQAARQRKKERFTALLHHIDLAMLRTAFYAIKRDAAPGVDGMTWEACTRRSKQERTGRYRPAGATFRRKTAASARWRSRPWKTRLSRGRRRRC